MAASSSSYRVFLSFRGEDTRHNFTAHLYKALRQRGIEAYIDSEDLERGQEISVLLSSIDQSKLSIVIFSKDYASSAWCMKEVAQIMRLWDTKKQMIIPIFYHVDPSEVQKQSGSFQEAFAKHETVEDTASQVQTWRSALTEVGSLSGWHITGNRPESIIIEEIVEDVVRKLHRQCSSNSKGLVGRDLCVEQIKSLLNMGQEDVRIVGIWGKGGIGKTTVARVVYNDIASQFEGCSFLSNVRENSRKFSNAIRDEFLSDILGDEKLKTCIGSSLTQDRLCSKRILVVVDDIDKESQLEQFELSTLLTGTPCFCPGSRFIVTSRNKHVLKQILNLESGISKLYELDSLDHRSSLLLFSQCAFQQDHSVEGFRNLTDQILGYAKGVPLALKILGRAVYGKSRGEWRSTLEKLGKVPNPEIHHVLRVSLDGLDAEERNIFLDIACFFCEYDNWCHVKAILEGCYVSVDCAISKLIDRCLLSGQESCQMHDLIREMGRYVDCYKTIEEPGETYQQLIDVRDRTRIWTPHDGYNMLKHYYKESKEVRGLCLNLSQVKSNICLDPNVFAKMTELRLLKLYSRWDTDNGRLFVSKRGLRHLPPMLRYLHWEDFPLKTFPSNFNAEFLVKINISSTKIKQLWKGVQNLRNLKFLHLKDCPRLLWIPDLSKAKNLVELLIYSCGIEVLHSSIWGLSKLSILSIRGCEKLHTLPSGICNLKLLRELVFSGCSNLDALALENLDMMESLEVLDLSETATSILPKSICRLNSLKILYLYGCPNVDAIALENLEMLESLQELDLSETATSSLSKSICKLKSLVCLYLGGCFKFHSFPEIMEPMENLKTLDLQGTALKELPSIEHLTCLVDLNLKDCSNLVGLPYNMGRLKSLELLNVGTWSEHPVADGFLLPPLSGLSSLTHLILQYLNWTEIPESLGDLSSLEVLDLTGSKFERLPVTIKKLLHLEALLLEDCVNLRSLPQLPAMVSELYADGCTSLQEISSDFWGQQDRTISFLSCWKLEQSLVTIILEDLWQASIQAPDTDKRSCCPCISVSLSISFSHALANNMVSYYNVKHAD